METNRANISFGRSIYINLGEQVVTQVLEEMKAARQTVAFTSFQLPEHPLEISDMTRLVELARSYEVDLIPDIAHKDLTKENIAALKKQGYRTYVWTNLETKRLLNVAVRRLR